MDELWTLSGSFWGLIFAHVVLIPLSCSAVTTDVVDPDIGDRSLVHLGLSHRLLCGLQTATRPGTLTVLVLHDQAQAAEVARAFVPQPLRTTSVELTSVGERRLYAGFGESSLTS